MKLKVIKNFKGELILEVRDCVWGRIKPIKKHPIRPSKEAFGRQNCSAVNYLLTAKPNTSVRQALSAVLMALISEGVDFNINYCIP